MHLELCPKFKYQKKQANTIDKEVEDGSDVDEKMSRMVLHNTYNAYEEKKKIKPFHSKVQTKKIRIDTLFDPSSQANLIIEEYIK